MPTYVYLCLVFSPVFFWLLLARYWPGSLALLRILGGRLCRLLGYDCHHVHGDLVGNWDSHRIVPRAPEVSFLLTDTCWASQLTWFLILRYRSCETLWSDVED